MLANNFHGSPSTTFETCRAQYGVLHIVRAKVSVVIPWGVNFLAVPFVPFVPFCSIPFWVLLLPCSRVGTHKLWPIQEIGPWLRVGALLGVGALSQYYGVWYDNILYLMVANMHALPPLCFDTRLHQKTYVHVTAIALLWGLYEQMTCNNSFISIT